MRALIRSTLLIFAALTVVTGLIYPLAVTGVAQLIFPAKTNGSLLSANGRNIGSRLIGQSFSDPKHLWGRPSATSPFPYNAASSSGSNLGPLNPALAKSVSERIATLRVADPGNTAPIPADLVTASGSGLDPHISPAAAAYQVARIAAARMTEEATVRSAIAKCSEGRQYGFLGEPRINVLCVNLTLDGIAF